MGDSTKKKNQILYDPKGGHTILVIKVKKNLKIVDPSTNVCYEDEEDYYQFHNFRCFVQGLCHM